MSQENFVSLNSQPKLWLVVTSLLIMEKILYLTEKKFIWIKYYENEYLSSEFNFRNAYMINNNKFVTVTQQYRFVLICIIKFAAKSLSYQLNQGIFEDTY